MSEVEDLLREAARGMRRDTAKKLSPEVDMARQAIQAQMNKGAKHVGGNAEDCRACDISNLQYPFICPGEGDAA